MSTPNSPGATGTYADDTTVGADERAPLHSPAGEDDGEYDYSAQKVAAEHAVRGLGERALIIRPGLIVGAGDPSDRFGYWAAAFIRAGSRPVLLPPLSGRTMQVVDVDDVAAYVVDATRSGVVNAVGDPHPLAEVLQRMRAAAGHIGETLEGDDDRLAQLGVAYWAGGRSLPLWLPAGMPGFTTRSNGAFIESGGVLSPLDDTIRRVVEDERVRGVDRKRKAGLAREDELSLLGTLSGGTEPHS